MITQPPQDTLFPYTTLFRSLGTYCEELENFRDREQSERLSRQSQDALEPAKGFACHLLASGKSYQHSAGEEGPYAMTRSEEHTSELQSLRHLVCRLLLEKRK